MKLYNYIIKDYIVAELNQDTALFKKHMLAGDPVVVMKDGEFLGVLNLKDMLNDSTGFIMDSFYNKPFVQVEDDSLLVLLTMCQNDFDFLPVMKAGQFQGVVSRKKLLCDILLLYDKGEVLQKDIQILDLKTEISMKNRFLVILGHDIKNLFMQVMGSLEMLDQRLRHLEEPKAHAALRLARRSAEQVNTAFESMLLWAQLGTGQLPFHPVELSLNEHINKVVSQLQLAGSVKNIAIKNCLADDFVIVADPNMLGCILLNLVYNAIKFTSAGGEILLHARKQENKILVIVEDNGLGMSLLQQQQLFAHGNSTKGTSNEVGTGIGLAICKDFVEKHNGKIEVESVHGQGTRVIISFPCMPSTHKKQERITDISSEPI